MIKCLKYALLAVLVSVYFWLPRSAATQNVSSSMAPSFVYSSDSITISLAKYKNNDKYVINDTIDLKGKTWYVPSSISLHLDGGFIRNGAIVGNKTKLEYNGCVFGNVSIKGQWEVPFISSTMFNSLDYDNSLKDLFALSNPDVTNKIIVDEGVYYLSALVNSDECLKIGSNTDVVIQGDVFLRPNDYTNYSILFLHGDNILINGKGSISGDKYTHTGTKGEWGMGVYVAGGNNVIIDGLTIKDCWGDCIYITKNAKNVKIENCVLDNGRRQGISIISAEDVTIKNCKIQNISGTNPAYAIDVEPNKGDIIRNVFIENVIVNNCRGGVASYGKAKDAYIETVEIKDCSVMKTERFPLSFISTKSVSVTNCTVKDSRSKQALECDGIEDINIKNLSYNGSRIRNNRRGKRFTSMNNVQRQIIK